MEVQPWGKILVPTQGRPITISLSSSMEMGPPPRWEMKAEHKDSWSTSLLPTSAGSLEKQESSRKTSISPLLTMPTPLTVWITKYCGESERDGDPDHLTCLLINLYAGQEATVRTGHGTTDWFHLEKEYVKAVYCHSAYLTYMQSTSCEMLGWMKHKLES